MENKRFIYLIIIGLALALAIVYLVQIISITIGNSHETIINPAQILNEHIDKKEVIKEVAEEVFYGDISVSVIHSGDYNWIILNNDGLETIVDEAPLDWPTRMDSLSFKNLAFSPQGNYLTYEGIGWEWSVGRIYNIEENEIKVKYFDTQNYGFTPSEEYFYDCTSAGMSTGVGVVIRKGPDFTEILNQHFNDEPYPLASKCELNENASVLEIILYDYQGEEAGRQDRYLYTFSNNELIQTGSDTLSQVFSK